MIYYPTGNTTYSFAGAMNNGAFSTIVTYTGSAGPKNKGYNLVPNPYPSAIDWDASSGWTKTKIDNAVYIWNNGLYASYVGGVGDNGGSRYISPGQSFFVYADGTGSPALSMDNSTRVHNSVSFLKNSQELPNVLRILSQANGFSDETVVRFNNEATSNYDGTWDAFKLAGDENHPVLGTVSSDDRFLSINCLLFTGQEVIVPVSFAYTNATSVTFTASGMESFAANVPIYLEDLTLSRMINLRQEPVYTFSYDPSEPDSRFRLHFAGPIGTEELQAASGKVFISHGSLFIDIPVMEGQEAEITVYNSLGQLLSADKVTMSGIVKSDAPGNSGMLLVRVTSPEHSFVTRVMNR
jgi:hypothetical protein